MDRGGQREHIIALNPQASGAVTGSTENGETEKRLSLAVAGQASSSRQERPAVERLVVALQKSASRQAAQVSQVPLGVGGLHRAAERFHERELREELDLPAALESGYRLRAMDHMEISRSAQDILRVSGLAMESVHRAVESWKPVLEVLSSVVGHWARSVGVWQDRLAVVGEVAHRLQRLAAEAAGPALVALEGIHDRLEIVSRLVQSPGFQAWLDQLSSQEFQEGLLRIMEQAEEADRLNASDSLQGDESDVAPLKDTLLMQWLLAFIGQMKLHGFDRAERMGAYAIFLPILVTLYFERGNDQDHAEMVALMRSQHQAQISQDAEAGQHSAESAAAMQALLALQLAEQSFEVIVDDAPMRSELSGPVSRRLARDDQVQVLAAAGKWRRVQAIDEEGDLIYGWMLNKHLQRVD